MRFVAVPKSIPEGETITSSIAYDLKVDDFNHIAKQ